MKRTILTAALVAAGFGIGGAQAASLTTLFNDAPANTLLSDNSAEALIDVDGDGTVSVGDILFGILDIGDIQGTQIGGVTAYNELTIIQANKILSFAPVDSDFNPGNGITANSQGVFMGFYTAGALTAADTALFDWSTGSILGGTYTFNTAFGATNDGKTLALVFEDSANNATRETTIQNGLDIHTDGDARLLVTIDTATDAGDTVQVIAPINPFTAPGLVGATNTSYAGSSFFLDGTIAQQNWPALFFLQDITAGTGGFSTPSATTAWPIFDNIDFTVTAQRVPEPAALALLGIGLLGMGFARRNKRA